MPTLVRVKEFLFVLKKCDPTLSFTFSSSLLSFISLPCSAFLFFAFPSSFPTFSLWHWSLGFALTIGIKLVQCSTEEKAQGWFYIWKALASGETRGPWVLLTKWHSSRWHMLMWGNKQHVQTKALMFIDTILICNTDFIHHNPSIKIH